MVNEPAAPGSPTPDGQRASEPACEFGCGYDDAPSNVRPGYVVVAGCSVHDRGGVAAELQAASAVAAATPRESRSEILREALQAICDQAERPLGYEHWFFEIARDALANAAGPAPGSPTLREALEAVLDCKGSYEGTVSQQGGYPAICSTCQEIARAALAAAGGGSGEPEQPKEQELGTPSGLSSENPDSLKEGTDDE